MPPEGASLDIDIKEIYRLSCAKCKKRLEALVRQKVARQSLDGVVKKVLEGSP